MAARTRQGTGRDERARDAAAARWPVLPWDRVPWRFPFPRAGVVAIGDLQGDLVALEAILRELELVDDGGAWRGGGRHLVLCGDLIGGHADAGLLVHRVRRLERAAGRAGGMVHALLGNHELLPARGEIGKWTDAEVAFWCDAPPAGAPSRSPADAFRGDSAPARWLRRRNAVVRIGDELFAHAGIDAWFAATNPGAVNATVRAWVAHWQGIAGAPPAATSWTVGAPGMERDSPLAIGPMWTRGFKPDGDSRPRGGPSRRRLQQWLAAVGVRRLVLGHAPVDGGEVLVAHPYYGDLVAMVDTRIVDPRRGSMTALCIDADGTRAVQVPQHRRDDGCRARELQALRDGETAPWLRWLPRPLRALFGPRRPQ